MNVIFHHVVFLARFARSVIATLQCFNGKFHAGINQHPEFAVIPDSHFSLNQLDPRPQIRPGDFTVNSQTPKNSSVGLFLFLSRNVFYIGGIMREKVPNQGIGKFGFGNIKDVQSEFIYVNVPTVFLMFQTPLVVIVEKRKVDDRMVITQIPAPVHNPLGKPLHFHNLLVLEFHVDRLALHRGPGDFIFPEPTLFGHTSLDRLLPLFPTCGGWVFVRVSRVVNLANEEPVVWIPPSFDSPQLVPPA